MRSRLDFLWNFFIAPSKPVAEKELELQHRGALRLARPKHSRFTSLAALVPLLVSSLCGIPFIVRRTRERRRLRAMSPPRPLAGHARRRRNVNKKTGCPKVFFRTATNYCFYLLDFAPLHFEHSTCKLFGILFPPLLMGIIWSICSPIPSGICFPQFWQV